MIIAVDFDGTIVTHEYPKIGRPVPDALDTLKTLNNLGHKIILWTMRSGQQLDEAVQYLKDNDVDIWGINENPDQKSWTNSPKQYAQIYIDDAALGCPLVESEGERPYVDWVKVWNYLCGDPITNKGERYGV